MTYIEVGDPEATFPKIVEGYAVTQDLSVLIG